MRLGQTITEIRKEQNMTQEDFARIFHVTRQTVSNWEKEKNYPDLETLIFMSEEFQISLDVMLKEDAKMVRKLNKEIKFSKKFKKNVCLVLWDGELFGEIRKIPWKRSLKKAWKRMAFSLISS